VKLVVDALSPATKGGWGLWLDDAQIVDVTAGKSYAGPAGSAGGSTSLRSSRPRHRRQRRKAHDGDPDGRSGEQRSPGRPQSTRRPCVPGCARSPDVINQSKPRNGRRGRFRSYCANPEHTAAGAHVLCQRQGSGAPENGRDQAPTLTLMPGRAADPISDDGSAETSCRAAGNVIDQGSRAPIVAVVSEQVPLDASQDPGWPASLDGELTGSTSALPGTARSRSRSTCGEPVLKASRSGSRFIELRCQP
jgi:hypothetical protein